MRKLILKMSLSADGFVAGPNGEIDWLLRTMDESTLAWVEATLWQAGVHIMGSRTFYDMAAYWPSSTDLLATPMNKIPKVVFSAKGSIDSINKQGATQALKDATRSDLEKGKSKSAVSQDESTWIDVPVASGDIGSEILKLKQELGEPILAHGGASFAKSLVNKGLIDEYRLLFHPVILGKGLSIFSDMPTPLDLKLTSSTLLKSGIIANIYKAVNGN